MTGDPPLLFSRSWRRNFKDPRRGQKHSLGPLIITTGVPLFGRGALFWIQNCSAGVPREAPFNFPAYLLLFIFLLHFLSISLRSLVLPSVYTSPSLSLLLSVFPSRPPDRLTNIFFFPLPVPCDPTVYQYFRARPASEMAPFRGIIETRTPRCSRAFGRSIDRRAGPIERGIAALSRSACTIATC